MRLARPFCSANLLSAVHIGQSRIAKKTSIRRRLGSPEIPDPDKTPDKIYPDIWDSGVSQISDLRVSESSDRRSLDLGRAARPGAAAARIPQGLPTGGVSHVLASRFFVNIVKRGEELEIEFDFEFRA